MKPGCQKTYVGFRDCLDSQGVGRNPTGHEHMRGRKGKGKGPTGREKCLLRLPSQFRFQKEDEKLP